jgi:acyl-CoA synthetase (AMP-forming)/AMP-acid ligase II
VNQPEPPVRNIGAHLARAAERWPDRPSVVVPAGREPGGRARYAQLSFADLHADAQRIARGLASVGITRGMRTVVMVKPGLDLFSLAFGLFQAGVVPVMVDPGMGVRNLKTCLAEARPQAFIGIPIAHALRVILGWGRGSIEHRVTVGRRWFWGGHTLEQVRAAGQQGEPLLVEPEPDELAAILFTSGGTGVPKGVEYVHGNFLAQVEAIRAMYDIQPGEVNLPTFPLFALFDPALGMTSVIPDMDATRPARVNPERIYEAVQDWNVTTMFGSPALLDTVGRHGEAHGTKLPTIKRVMSAGAPVLAPVMERFLGMLGQDAVIVTPYGATESLPVASLSSREVLGETRHVADAGGGVCVGMPVPSIRVAILPIHDEVIEAFDPGAALPVGEVGEICVQGPQVTRAYFGRERATALAKIPDPAGGFWHRMGDLGYLDAQGRLWFCGRKAHRVEVGDRRWLSIPSEAVFSRHPAVRRSALVRLDLPDGVQPGLCVELEPGVSVDEGSLIAELRALGAEHEHTAAIQRFLLHPGFPVDIRHNAKVDRLALSRWASGKFGG